MSGTRTNPPHVVVASTRRSWSREEKRGILAETRDPDATVLAVARRHGLHPSLLFRWRRDALDEERAASRPAEPAFVPLLLPGPANTAPVERAAASNIEIVLAGGHRVRAHASVDAALLRSVIEALTGR